MQKFVSNIEVGRDTNEIEKAVVTGDWVRLSELAKKDCKKCYGRGYIGTDEQGNKVPCSCVLKRRQEILEKEAPHKFDDRFLANRAYRRNQKKKNFRRRKR